MIIWRICQLILILANELVQGRDFTKSWIGSFFCMFYTFFLFGFFYKFLRIIFLQNQHHEKAREIFEQYISGTSNAVPVERATLKGMESFMLGDTVSISKLFLSHYYLWFLLDNFHLLW